MTSRTDRFGTPYPDWKADFQKWQEEFKAYVQGMDSLVFANMEAARITPMNLPNVEIYTSGTDKKFRMASDAVFISRTNNVRITIVHETELTLIPGSIIGAIMTPGAVGAQETEFQIFQGGTDINPSIQIFGAVDSSYGILWYNGSRLAPDAGLYQLFAFQSQAVSGDLVKISATDTVAGYLEGKITAGAAISVDILNPGGTEEVQISFDGDADDISDGSTNVMMLATERTKLSGAETTSHKSQANGYASLDSGGKVPVAELPSAVLGATVYRDTWNATTNTPSLYSATGTQGYYYIVNVAGATNLDGITDWKIGDYAIYNGTAWGKIDNTDQVSSVFGRTGAVEATSGDYTAAQVTNAFDKTADNSDDLEEGTTNLLLTPAERSIINTPVTLNLAAANSAAVPEAASFFIGGTSQVPNVEIKDGVLLGGDKSNLLFSPSRLVKSWVNPASVYFRTTLIIGDFIYCGDSPTNTLYKVNSITGKTVQSSIPSEHFGYRSMGYNGEKICSAYGAVLTEIDPENINNVDLVSIDVSVGDVRGNIVFSSPTVGFCVNQSYQIFKLEKTGGGGTTWVATLLTPAGTVQAHWVACDSTSYYIGDLDGDVYSIKRYLISAGALTGTYIAPAAMRGSGASNGMLYVNTTSRIYVINPSDMTLKYSDTTSFSAFGYSSVQCGMMIGTIVSSPYTIQAFSLPCQTQISPKRLVTQTLEISSDCPDIADVKLDSADIIRAVIGTNANSTSIKRLNTAVGGISIVSVVSSAPASPTDGDWYLLESGELINYIDGAWATYAAYEGAVVRNIARNRDMQYLSGAWVELPINITLRVTQNLLTSETINFAYTDYSPSLIGAGEVIPFVMEIAATVNGQKLVYLASVRLALSQEGIVRGTAIVDVDTITGNYGITSLGANVELSAGDPGARFEVFHVKAYVGATGGMTDDVDIEWSFRLVGSPHSNAGLYC